MLNKIKENLRTLKIFTTILGIQIFSVWLCVFLVSFFFYLSAQVSVIIAMMWITYGAIPIMFNSFILTLVYKYAIIPRLDGLLIPEDVWKDLGEE